MKDNFFIIFNTIYLNIENFLQINLLSTNDLYTNVQEKKLIKKLIFN